MTELTPAPLAVAQMVNDYIRSERRDARQYDNRTPLDESGVWALHGLARDLYAAGWRDGHLVGIEEMRGVSTDA